MLRQKYNQLPFDLVYDKTYPGSARQRNIGANLGRGKYLFFFDDDVILEPEYIHFIEDSFNKAEDQHLGGMTGRIINAEHFFSRRSW